MVVVKKKFWKALRAPTSIAHGHRTENLSLMLRPMVSSPDLFGGNLSLRLHNRKLFSGRLQHKPIFIKPPFPRMADGLPTFLMNRVRTTCTLPLTLTLKANGKFPPSVRRIQCGEEMARKSSLRA